MPLRKRERGSGMWGASRTVDEAGEWWAGQCGRPGSVVGRVLWVGRGGGESGPLSAGAVAAPRIVGWAWTGIGVGNGSLGQARTSIGVGMGRHWGRKRVTGAGNGALGQANYLPQWVFSCPDAYSPI